MNPSLDTPVDSRSRSSSTSASVRSYGTTTVAAPQSRNDSTFKLPATNDAANDETTPLLAGSTEPEDSWVGGAALKETWVIIRFAVPTICTMLLEYSFIVTSVVAIGHLSTEQLAGAALGEITAGVTGYSILQGFACALDSVLPQAWTSGTPTHVGLWTQRMMVLAVALLAPILGIWLNAKRILLNLHQEPMIAGYAALYLKYAAFQLPGFAFNQVVRQVFSAQGLMHVPSIITIIIAPLNMGLNYLLVWGPEPIRLGFIGAPIATSISMTLMSGLYLGYGIWFASHEAWHPISSKMFKSLPILFRLGITGVGQYAAEWWSWELVSLTASQFGPTTMAAQSVLVASSSSAYMAPGALAVACAVRIGHFLGAGDAHGARLASRVSIILACIQSMILASIFLSLRSRLAYFFNNDPAVAKLVSGIVPLLAAYQIVDGIAAITTGVLRACGKLSIGAASNFVGYYILGIPLGIYLAFVHHFGLFGLWIGLAFALSFVAVVLYVVILRLDWDVQVREAKERIEAGEENIGEGTHA